MIVELLILVVLILLLVYKRTRRPEDMPPGTFGLPLIGHLPPTATNITEHLGQLKQKYGNIFTTKWGSLPVVVLAEPSIIRKGLNHPDIQGRPDIYSMQIFNHFQNLGVLFASDSVWKDNRRFLLHNLRNLGMGKSHLEDSIIDEAQMLVEYLTKNCLDEPRDLDYSFNVAVLNVIWQMLASKRFEPDDEKIIHYNKMVFENMSIIQGPIFIVDMMPWLLRVVPFWLLDKCTNVNRIFVNRNDFQDQCYETIMEHRKTFDPENPRDIIDHHFLEMDQHKSEPRTSPCRQDYFDLISVMGDMFTTGSETTSTTLRWTVLYMALNQEIQRKAHAVLDAVVPRHRLPTLEDRPGLSYIDALLLDVIRMSSLVPTNVPHCTTQEVYLEGYRIPKNTMVIATLELVHKDPAYWEKPNQLHPEHFLDADGNLDSKKEQFMPFGVGRRQCLAESLARMEVFLFASAILQRFTINPPPGVQLDSNTDFTKKLLNHPKPFKVVLKRRE